MKLLRNQRTSWRRGLGLLALIGVLIYAAAITATPRDSKDQYSEQEVTEDKSSSDEVEKSSDENLEDHEPEEHDDDDDEEHDDDDDNDDVSTPINHPPTADAGTIQSVRVGQSVSLDGALSNDPDGGAIASYSWSFSVIPAGSSAFLTSADTVAPSFKPDLPGTYTVQLVVSDGELSSTPATVDVVATSNASPVINTTAVTTGTVNQPYTYDVNASDADGDTLTYTLTSAPTGMTIDSSTGLIEWMPSTDGTFPVTVVVTDRFGGQAIHSFSLQVHPAISRTGLEFTAASDKLVYSVGELPIFFLSFQNRSDVPLQISLTNIGNTRIEYVFRNDSPVYTREEPGGIEVDWRQTQQARIVTIPPGVKRNLAYFSNPSYLNAEMVASLLFGAPKEELMRLHNLHNTNIRTGRREGIALTDIIPNDDPHVYGDDTFREYVLPGVGTYRVRFRYQPKGSGAALGWNILSNEVIFDVQ